MSVELLARLNPTTVKFDTGRGGIVELTAQDIAAALGMVPEGLGREVLMIVGWPDGAMPQKILEYGMAIACAELNRQFDAATTAGIRYALAQWENSGRRRQVEIPKQVTTRWPRNAVEKLPFIIAACANELRNLNLCECCDGRGSFMADNLSVKCAECKGSGVTPISDRKRAGMMKVDHKTYAETWRAVYIWMLGQMTDAYLSAARILRQKLAGSQPPPEADNLKSAK